LKKFPSGKFKRRRKLFQKFKIMDATTNMIYDKLSLTQYIDFLGDMGYRLKNIKNSNISLTERKKAIYETICEKIEKLDSDKKTDLKNKFDELFEVKPKQKQIKKVESDSDSDSDSEEENDLSSFTVGEVVLVYNKYHVKERSYNIYVKCKVHKINKCSVTLQKYKCNVDFTDFDKGFREQTFGKLYFNWTDELEEATKQNFINIRDLSKIKREGWSVYKNYVKQQYHSSYFGD
jgi:DNA-binding transcriptional MerR regulator